LINLKKTEKLNTMKKIILFNVLLFFFSAAITAQTNFGEARFFNENEKTPELKIYPNPCKTEKITLEYSNTKISEYQITNIAGKMVQQEKFIFPEYKKQIQINNLQDGIYLVRVKSDENRTFVKKLIVSKN